MGMPSETRAAYLRLRGALLADPYPPLSDTDAAAALRSRTVTRPRRFRWKDVRSVALAAGQWALVDVLSRRTPALPPTTQQDIAILAAINAVAMEPDQEIDPQNEAQWTTYATGVTTLRTAGCLSQPVADALLALGAESVTEGAAIGWAEVTEHDVRAARGMTDGGE